MIVQVPKAEADKESMEEKLTKRRQPSGVRRERNAN
jgi:hypothetical protein